MPTSLEARAQLQPLTPDQVEATQRELPEILALFDGGFIYDYPNRKPLSPQEIEEMVVCLVPTETPIPVLAFIPKSLYESGGVEIHPGSNSRKVIFSITDEVGESSKAAQFGQRRDFSVHGSEVFDMDFQAPDYGKPDGTGNYARGQILAVIGNAINQAGKCFEVTPKYAGVFIGFDGRIRADSRAWHGFMVA